MPQACNFISEETLVQVFRCEYCEISKNTFFEEHLWWLLLRINKMVKRNKVSMSPQSFKINFKINSHISIGPLVLYLFAEFLLKSSVKLVYLTMVWEHVQIWSVRITGNCIRELKNETRHFHSCAPQRTLPHVFFTSAGRGKLIILQAIRQCVYENLL